MYVCVCNAVTEKQVFSAVSAGARTVKDLKNTLGVGAECGRCASCAKQCLKQALRPDEIEIDTHLQHTIQVQSLSRRSNLAT